MCDSKRLLRDSDVCEAINAAAEDAGNRVFDFGTRFTRRAEYRPVETLADEVQEAVVETFVRVLREEGVT